MTPRTPRPSILIGLSAALGAAGPLAARTPPVPTEKLQVLQQQRVAKPQGHAHPTTRYRGREYYAIPIAPRDTRTPRQRCIDDAIAQEDGPPSDLAMHAIDLKCSQR